MQVLRFYGWYKQTVHESPDEHYRVRHVNLYYYLEDDSIAVVEPHVENSGMPQGTCSVIEKGHLHEDNVDIEIDRLCITFTKFELVSSIKQQEVSL